MFTEDVRQAPNDEIVCYCSDISKGRILAAIRSGARTLDDVKRSTGACQAGRCREMNPRGR